MVLGAHDIDLAVQAEGLGVVKFVLFSALPEQPLVDLRCFLHLRAHLVWVVLLLFNDLIDDDLLFFLLDGVDYS